MSEWLYFWDPNTEDHSESQNHRDWEEVILEELEKYNKEFVEEARRFRSKTTFWYE